MNHALSRKTKRRGATYTSGVILTAKKVSKIPYVTKNARIAALEDCIRTQEIELNTLYNKKDNKALHDSNTQCDDKIICGSDTQCDCDLRSDIEKFLEKFRKVNKGSVSKAIDEVLISILHKTQKPIKTKAKIMNIMYWYIVKPYRLNKIINKKYAKDEFKLF